MLFEEAFKLNSKLKKKLEYGEKTNLSDSMISSHDSLLTDYDNSSF